MHINTFIFNLKETRHCQNVPTQNKQSSVLFLDYHFRHEFIKNIFSILKIVSSLLNRSVSFNFLHFCFYMLVYSAVDTEIINSFIISVRTALLAIIGFMPTHGGGALGSLNYTPDERKALA